MIAQYLPDLAQGAVREEDTQFPIQPVWTQSAQEAIPRPHSPAAIGERENTEKLRQNVVPAYPSRELEGAYVIENRSAVDSFIRQNRSVLTLLINAREPLNAVFGETRIRVLRLLCDDEGVRTLFCFVLFPGVLRDAMVALQAFDHEWWLDKCAQVAGKLNFDFELS